MSFIHHYHKMKHVYIVHIHLHHAIIIGTIGTSQKIYKKLTSIYYELTHNLYIHYITSDYMQMKISLNDHNSYQYLQIVLCIYNTYHIYYSP